MDFINEKLSKMNEFLQDKKIAIIGVDFNNVKLAEYLYNIQADEVVVFDTREIEYINGDLMDKIITYGMEFSLGENCFRKLEGFDIIFRSPDYLPSIAEILNEEQRGAKITSELELFIELCPAPIIGVAGTDGKTTISEMIYDILKNGERNCYIGGFKNLSILSQIEKITPNDIVVLKLTNKQLINMKTSPDISIITNIDLEGLNINYSEEEYIDALRNMFINKNEEGILILNYDDTIVRQLAKEAQRKVIFFSEDKIDEGYIISDNKIKVCEGELRIHLLDTRNIFLRGIHNIKNATCAIIATSEFVDLDISLNTIKNYRNLENRLELIYESEDRITWYNDSLSINPSRTITALNSFALRNVILIAGGDSNYYNYDRLAVAVVNSCKALILEGENAQIIEEQVKNKLRRTGNKINIYKSKNIEESVEIAKNIAVKGDVVLLSPTTNYYTKYTNNEEMGEEFKKVIEKVIIK